MKKVVGPALAAVLIAVTAIVSYAVSTYITINQQHRSVPTITYACPANASAHHYQIFILAGKLSAPEVDGHLCDTLTITNQDDRLRLMAFGKHDHHQAYDGVVEKVLSKGESLMITFDQLGTFLFHDHLQDEVHGSFTVSE